jgi:hypothetical protein
VLLASIHAHAPSKTTLVEAVGSLAGGLTSPTQETIEHPECESVSRFSARVLAPITPKPLMDRI